MIAPVNRARIRSGRRREALSLIGVAMESTIRLNAILTVASDSPEGRLSIFAVVTLGIIESLANGSLSTKDVVLLFFNADNCVHVRKHLKDKLADRIMSHGVQLPDLFDVLPAEEAQRQFLHELNVMRSLCFQLIDKARVAA
jgi:hypothetical protein